MAWQEKLEMTKAFYRKVSTDEAKKIVNANKLTTNAKNGIETFKYLTSSCVKAIRFQNRHCIKTTDDLPIIKFEFDERILNDIFKNLAFNENDPYGKNLHVRDLIKEYDGQSIYNFAHNIYHDFIDIGMNREMIELLNENITNINVLDDETLAKEMIKNIKGRDLVLDQRQELDENEIFVALPYDLAVLAGEYNSLSTEGLNFLKGRVVSKDLERLKAAKPHSSINIVGLDRTYDFKNADIDLLTEEKIKKLNSRIVHNRNNHLNYCSKSYMKDAKTNVFAKNDTYFEKAFEHEKKEVGVIEPLTEEQMDKITTLLSDVDNLDIKEVGEILEIFNDSIGINQISPIHKFTVAEHILATVKSVDKAIEIMNLEKDVEYTEGERMELKWTMLLHDIGKPHSIDIKTIYRQFPKHELVSSEITNKLLENCTEMNVSRIVSNICEHDKFYSENEKNTVKNYKKLAKNAGIIEDKEIESMHERKQKYKDDMEKQMNHMAVVKIADIIGQDLMEDKIKYLPVLQRFDLVNEYIAQESDFKIKDLSIRIGDVIKLLKKEKDIYDEVDIARESKKLTLEFVEKAKDKPELFDITAEELTYEILLNDGTEEKEEIEVPEILGDEVIILWEEDTEKIIGI